MIETVSPGWANGFRPTAPRCECDTSEGVSAEFTGSGVVAPTKKKKWDSEKTPAVFEKTRFFLGGGGERVVEFWFGIQKKR